MRDRVDALRRGDDFDRTFALARRAVLKRLLAESTETGELAARLGGSRSSASAPDYYDTLAKYVAAVSPAQVKALIAERARPPRTRSSSAWPTARPSRRPSRRPA